MSRNGGLGKVQRELSMFVRSRSHILAPMLPYKHILLPIIKLGDSTIPDILLMRDCCPSWACVINWYGQGESNCLITLHMRLTNDSSPNLRPARMYIHLFHVSGLFISHGFNLTPVYIVLARTVCCLCALFTFTFCLFVASEFSLLLL